MKVYPLLAGELIANWGLQVLGEDLGKTLPSPSYMFYIEGASHRIIVDTSFGDPKTCKEQLGEDCKRSPESELDAVLARVGLKPAEVDLVIMTHLHWDHVGQLNAFPKAKIIVQAREIPWAFTPPKWALGYFRALAPSLAGVMHRMEIIDGEKMIVEGVHAVWVGGHTPGSQIVTVQTSNGEVVIAGDAVFVYENLEQDVPIGLFHSLEESYKVLSLLRDPGKIVLPGHDWRVIERYGDGI